jgi:hypothetical protein
MRTLLGFRRKRGRLGSWAGLGRREHAERTESMHDIARQPDAREADDGLAEVIPLLSTEVPSFYQRNTGALPRIGQRSSDLHRRATLPSPVNEDSDGIFQRIKKFVGDH